MKKFILSLLFISSVSRASERSFFDRAGAYLHSKLFGLDLKVTGSPEAVSLPHDLYSVSLYALGTGETEASLLRVLHGLATESQIESNEKFAFINALTNHTTHSYWEGIERRRKIKTEEPKVTMPPSPPSTPTDEKKMTGAVFACQVAGKLFVGIDGKFRMSSSGEQFGRKVTLGNRSYQVHSFTPSVGFEATILDPMNPEHYLKITA